MKVPKMDKKIKAKWLRALRSGKYKQGKGVLRSGDNRFCCLGVLVDVVGCEWTADAKEISAIVHKDYKTIKAYGIEGAGESHTLPDGLSDKYGIPRDRVRDLIEINDSGKRFQTIAEYIRKNL